MLDLVESDEDETLRMLRDSARAWLAQAGGTGRARALRFAAPGFDPAVLAEMAGMGWLGLGLPEALGGSGLGAREMGALATELGRVLAPEPVIETALSAALLAAAAPEAPLLADLAERGTAVLTAWQEGRDGLEAAGSAAGARRLAAGAAAVLALRREAGGCLLLRLPAPADAPEQLVDGGALVQLRPGAGAEALGRLDDATVAAALDAAALAAGFYLCGLAEAALAITLDHLATREQFGRPIGSFQVLQHRAVDALIALELARASCRAAALDLDGGAAPARRAAAVSRAKARASESALFITRAAIQLHGGIGYTDEHDIGLYLRKAMVLAHAWGSPRWHRDRYRRAAQDLGN